MRLGSCVFEHDPDRMTPIKRVKASGGIETYESAVMFEWEALLAGVPVLLFWDMMPTAQYADLNAKFMAGDTYEFNPDIGIGRLSFYAKILSFSGVYERVILDDFDFRRNVRMELMITAPASTTTTTSTTTSTTSTTSTTTA